MTNAQLIGLDGCWIDPNGKQYDVSFCRHAQVAQDLASAVYGESDIDPVAAEVLLTVKGWLHVGLNYIGKRQYNDLSDAQIDALFNLYRSCGQKLYNAISAYMRGE